MTSSRADGERTVGVDGLSVLFLPLASLLTLLVIVSAWSGVPRLRGQLVALFGLHSTFIGVFCALDMALFFTFWELMLIPSYFLIGSFGVGPERRRAAVRYVTYMLVGSAPVLLAIVLLAASARGPQGAYAFDYVALLKTSLPPRLQTWIFFLLLFGFAVKGPLFPFHTWLPSTLMESPFGMGVMLVGVKLGAYGIIRFVLPLAPEASARHMGILSVLGAVGIVYAALIALAQPNLRRMLAFSSVSHVGFVMVGLASMTHQGMQGAVLQMITMGLVSTGLLFAVGFLYSRLGTSDLSSMGGLAARAPVLTLFFFLIGLASIGLPGTAGFVGEHLILLGTFRADWRVAAVALLGVILGAAYFFRHFERAFLGPITRPSANAIRDLRPREILVLASLSVIILCAGIYPRPLAAVTDSSVRALTARVRVSEGRASPAAELSSLDLGK
ncbi:MAG TPA: NADH-quinone oxidoreductase subunit M [Polyangiaceae bacterium]|nr:NADH-quinone oxidoreductase subunit M [Polyangiaceae bacterium]